MGFLKAALFLGIFGKHFRLNMGHSKLFLQTSPNSAAINPYQILSLCRKDKIMKTGYIIQGRPLLLAKKHSVKPLLDVDAFHQKYIVLKVTKSF